MGEGRRAPFATAACITAVIVVPTLRQPFCLRESEMSGAYRVSAFDALRGEGRSSFTTARLVGLWAPRLRRSTRFP